MDGQECQPQVEKDNYHISAKPVPPKRALVQNLGHLSMEMSSYKVYGKKLWLIPMQVYPWSDSFADRTKFSSSCTGYQIWGLS